MVHFRADTVQPQTKALNTQQCSELSIGFRTDVGGRILITSSDDRNLAAVHIADDISAEIIDDSVDAEEALKCITQSVNEVDDARADQVAKYMKDVKRKAEQSHRWKLSTAQSHKGLAKVMCAVTDVMSKLCMLGKEQRNTLIRWLIDSCCDTHLVAREVVTAMGLWDKVDTSKRITMGTAGPDTFRTEGVVAVPCKVREHGSKVWHTIELEMHVTDTGGKCLVSQKQLQCCGWKFVYEHNKKGGEGSFMVAPDGIIFALHSDEHGFPILATEGAPIARFSSPDQQRCQLALMHLIAENYDTDTDNSDCELVDACSSDDESDIMAEAFISAGNDIANKAAKVVADEQYQLKTKKQSAMRTRPPVHTPESWHSLMHSGKLLSEATAVGSDARFNLGGKVKSGKDLNSDDLEKLDLARKACTICKQTKLKAPAERKSVHFTADEPATTLKHEQEKSSKQSLLYTLPKLE